MLAGHQVPTRTAVPLPSAGQGNENRMKGSWIERRTGRDHPPVTVTAKTDST